MKLLLMLLLCELPALTQENWNAVALESQKQPVNVLFVTESCPPCIKAKNLLKDLPRTYVCNDEVVRRKMTGDHIKKFPALSIYSHPKNRVFIGYDKIEPLYPFLKKDNGHSVTNR
jgi:glutaredoxin